jgi:hypothetical protein
MTAANLPVISGHIKPSGIILWPQSAVVGLPPLLTYGEVSSPLSDQ